MALRVRFRARKSRRKKLHSVFGHHQLYACFHRRRRGSVPGIAGLLFTVGKMAYDLIVTDKEIDQTIGKIVRLRINMSENASRCHEQGSYPAIDRHFDKSLLAVNRQLPPMAAMWDAEQTKVRQVINAINAGANPTQIIDLVAMPAASASWNTLSDFCIKLSQVTRNGQPVTVTTTKPVTTLNRYPTQGVSFCDYLDYVS